MKLANIIYYDELVNHELLDYVNYFEGRDVDKSIIDFKLPTLIVGWTFMHSEFNENELIKSADILNHTIVSNELYWEFSFMENKQSHIKGIESFVKYIPNFYFKKYSYINLDPVFFQIKDFDDLFDVLPLEIDSIFNLENKMFYLIKDTKIWGLNCGQYDFFEFDIEKIWNKLNERSSSIKITDENGDIYKKYYKLFPEFPQLKRYLIVILSKL